MKRRPFDSSKLPQYFLQGLLVLAPISVTVYIIYGLFTWLDQLLPVYINVSSNPDEPFYLPGIGFLLVLAVVLIVGYLSSFFMVSRLLSVFDALLERTPGVKIIYSLVKDFSEAIAGKKKKFKSPVMVSIFQPDVWQVGFITNESVENFGLEDYITVYVPSSYAVMGVLYFVKRDRIRILKDFPPANVLKFAISGGVAEIEDSLAQTE